VRFTEASPIVSVSGAAETPREARLKIALILAMSSFTPKGFVT
jgi:hypothetical protein